MLLLHPYPFSQPGKKRIAFQPRAGSKQVAFLGRSVKNQTVEKAAVNGSSLERELPENCRTTLKPAPTLRELNYLSRFLGGKPHWSPSMS